MKQLFSILFCVTFFCFANAVFAQQPDSVKFQNLSFGKDSLVMDVGDTQVDTTGGETKKRSFVYRLFKEDYPNPNKALFLSLAIPGGGQFYNKRWWKVPIVYAGYAALIYSAQYNRSNYRDLRDAVIAEYEQEEPIHKFSHLNLSVNDLERLRDQFDKRKQLSYIGLFALHLVQTAEAFVDCHLKTFDVSDDLSMKIGPSLQPVPQPYGLAPGLGISFSIK